MRTVMIDPLRVEQFAAKKNMPRKALAVEIGISYQSLNNILNRCEIMPYSACLIANVLDVDVHEIITVSPRSATKNLPKKTKRGPHTFVLDMDAIFSSMAAIKINSSELASRCGFSRQWASQIFIRGRASMPTIAILANALEVQAENLIAVGCTE